MSASSAMAVRSFAPQFPRKGLREPAHSPDPRSRLEVRSPLTRGAPRAPSPSPMASVVPPPNNQLALVPAGQPSLVPSPNGQSSLVPVPMQMQSAVPLVGSPGMPLAGILSAGGAPCSSRGNAVERMFSPRHSEVRGARGGSIHAKPMSSSTTALNSSRKQSGTAVQRASSVQRAVSTSALRQDQITDLSREIDALRSATSQMTCLEPGANASTCASSFFSDSSLHGITNDASHSSSSRVLFAKASELIRVEITACERRFAARLQEERSAREASHTVLKTSMASMVSIVEALSTVPQASGSDTSHIADALSSSLLCQNQFAAQMEEEQKNNAKMHASLLSKIEAVSSKMPCLPAAGSIDEDRINSLLEQERKQRISAINAIQQDIKGLTEELHSLPSALIDGAAQWSKYNMLLDKERVDRESSCCDLRKDVDSLLRQTQGVDDDYLKVMFEQERRVNDLARATQWKDFCKEMEALSVEVQAMKKSPNGADNGSTTSAQCAKLQQDVEGLANELRAAQENVEVLAMEMRSPAITGSSPSPSPGPWKTSPGPPQASPLQARLESTAHLAFQSESESTRSLAVQDMPTQPAVTQDAFGAVFATGY